MRIAKVIHIIVRKRGRSMVGGFLDVYQLLESLVTQKWSRGVRRGANGKVSFDNSLVAYPTLRTVLRAAEGEISLVDLPEGRYIFLHLFLF